MSITRAWKRLRERHQHPQVYTYARHGTLWEQRLNEHAAALEASLRVLKANRDAVATKKDAA